MNIATELNHSIKLCKYAVTEPFYIVGVFTAKNPIVHKPTIETDFFLSLEETGYKYYVRIHLENIWIMTVVLYY